MAFAPKDDPVAKGAVTHCLDAVSVQPEARARLDALRLAIIALQNQQFRGLAAVFADHLFPYVYINAPNQIAQITRYLQDSWFNEATGWWPAFQPIEPIYALGLIQGLRESLSVSSPQPLPIDSYWIIGHDKVELINLVSKQQVTLLIATPTPPEPAPSGIWSESSEAWVTARRAGRIEGEIEPITGQGIGTGATDLRVRAFKIRNRRPRPPA